MIYRIRNPKSGETLKVIVESQQDETELRNLIAICGWEILETS
jgi:hypothetical protein